MPRIPEERIRRLKTGVDPLSLAEQYSPGKPRRTGSEQFDLCCPIHGENTASFHVYIDQPFTPYHCFGCDWHGDAITLVQEMENLEFRDAVEWLERWAGIVPCLDAPAPAVVKREPPPPEKVWSAIQPIPDEALASMPQHIAVKTDAGWQKIMPTHRHEYRDGAGRLCFLVYRSKQLKQLASGKCRPLSYCENAVGERRWMQVFPDRGEHGRIMYGLDRLAAHPDWLFCVVEGEKAVDAAARMLESQKIVAVGAGIGAWNATCTDWRPLLGRTGFVWPDANDPAGAHFAWDVNRILNELEAATT